MTPNPLAIDLATALSGASRLDAWRADPVLYARERLGVVLWSRQAEIARAFVTSKAVAVRSAHKLGKSKLAAVIALWWAEMHPHALVILTSAGSRQVRRVLWKEITDTVREARAAHAKGMLPHGIDDSFPTPALVPDKGLEWPDGRAIVGFATDEAELMAGFSSDELLYLVDEASGVDEPIFEAMEGNLASGGTIGMFSNPTRLAGKFYDAFHKHRGEWTTFHISCLESPNVIAGRKVVPGLAMPEYVEKRRRAYGEKSALYAVRVLGNFPSTGNDNVIPVHLIEAARKRWDELPKNDNGEPDITHPEVAALVGNAVLDVGVDVARFGDDDSVIWPRRGKVAFIPRVVHGQDTQAVAGHALAAARDHRRYGERPRLKVDGIGVGGGVVDAARANAGTVAGTGALAGRTLSDVEVLDVNVASAATADGFARLRDQIWFAVRDWLEEGGCLPPDDEAEAELADARYSFDASGRQKVEPKDEMKERLGRSPDRADALGLAVYMGGRSVPLARAGRTVREMASKVGGF